MNLSKVSTNITAINYHQHRPRLRTTNFLRTGKESGSTFAFQATHLGDNVQLSRSLWVNLSIVYLARKTAVTIPIPTIIGTEIARMRLVVGAPRSAVVAEEHRIGIHVLASDSKGSWERAANLDRLVSRSIGAIDASNLDLVGVVDDHVEVVMGVGVGLVGLLVLGHVYAAPS